MLRQEQVHELDEQDSCRRCNDKRKCSEHEDEYGVDGQELVGLGWASHCKTEQHNDNVIQCVAGRLCQTGCLAGLLEQVSEEEHTEQWQTWRYEECGEQQSDNWEENTLCLTNATRRLHADKALLLCGKQTHQWRLDNRNKSHIRISTHCDSTHQVRTKLWWKEDSRRTVSSTNDSNTGSLIRLETERKGNHICSKDTELCGSTDKYKLRIADKRWEIRHRTDTEENQWRIPALTNALIEDIQHGIILIQTNLQSCICTERDVSENDTETNRNEQ